MKIGVVGNSTRKENREILQRFVAFLEKRGYETVIFSTNREIDGVDILIVLGGDGAILHAATIAAQKRIKMIGINYGNLGFLAEYEKPEEFEICEFLKKVEAGDCRILKRSLLELQLRGETHYALNEVALQRYFDEKNPYETQILKLHITVGDGSDDIAGDGVLISTPTGSTAYSLSAGGAILTPEVPAFLLTPICAFSMSKRPIVFPDSEEFKISVTHGKTLVLVDGRVVGYLSEGEELLARKAPFAAEFPIRKETDFFRKIQKKLNK